MSLHDERRLGLLADRVLGMLDQADAAELDDLLLDAEEGATESQELEYAAAALALSELRPEAMPADVQARVEARVVAQLGNVVPFARPVARNAPVPAPATRVNARMLLLASGWIVAAAAIFLAVWAWWPREPSGVRPSAMRGAQELPRGVRAEPTPEMLLARGDSVRVDFARTKDKFAGVATGDVVWSADLQKGYMRIRGLPRNDPSAIQYQLWIFDKGRPTQYPVDGGVFDVGADGVVVPISAKLKVGSPVLFAITVEKPGGVVVSKREHIVLAAAIKS